MTDDPVLISKSGPILWLTLNRPDVLNAQNMEVRDHLWTYMQAFADDPDSLVLVIKGNGPRAFSAGADLSEFGTAPSVVESRRARRERDLWQRFQWIDKPMIAAIHGYCLGAGFEMSMSCDFRIATDDAKFGLPEANLGYIPSAGGTQLLPRLIPPGIAMGLLLTANQIDAAEALRLGLINRIVPRESLLVEAESLAMDLASRPQHSLRLAKQAILRGLEMPLSDGLLLEHRLSTRAG